MKIIPYKVEAPKLIQGEKVCNLSQLIYQQRLQRYIQIVKQKCASLYPELQEHAFRVASPSQSSPNEPEEEMQLLIGVLVAKYPKRQTAVQKFAGLLPVEFQGGEALDLSAPVFYLKCEHVVVELIECPPVQPGVVVGVRGCKTSTEKFKVCNLVFPFEYEFSEVSLDSLSLGQTLLQNNTNTKSISTQSTTQSNLQPTFIFQNQLTDLQFEALMSIPTRRVPMLLNAPFQEDIQTDFEFSPTGSFLKNLYDFKKVDQQVSQLSNKFQIVLESNLQSCVGKSFPLQPIPLQIFELMTLQEVQSVGNPVRFEIQSPVYTSTPQVQVVQVGVQVVDGYFYKFYEESEVVEQMLRSGLLMSQIGGLIDVYNVNEEFNQLDCDFLVIMSQKTETKSFSAVWGEKKLKIVFLGKEKGIAVREDGGVVEFI